MKILKWCAILPVMAFLLCAVLFAHAADNPQGIQSGDWIYVRVGDGADVIRYTGKDTDVVIPDTLDGLPVIAVGQSGRGRENGLFAEEDREKIQSVHIPESVVYIHPDTFAWCRGLNSVNIPEKIMTIQDGTFQRTGLTKIELPPSLWEIGRDAFAGTPLEEIRLPATLCWIDRCAFQDCTRLKGVEWPNDEIRLGEGAFENTGIPDEGFTLPACYEGYTNRYYFYSPADRTGRDESIGGVTIQYVLKPDDTIGLLSIQVSGEGPKTLKLPSSIDGYPVTSVNGDLDDWNDQVETLILPDTLTEIGDLALKTIKVQRLDLPKGLKRIGNEACQYCYQLKDLKLPDSLRYLGSFAFTWVGDSAPSSIDSQLGNLDVERPHLNAAQGSIGHYLNYDFVDDGMIFQMDWSDSLCTLFICDVDASCTLLESPADYCGIRLLRRPGDSLLIRGGVAYRLNREEENTVSPVQVTDFDAWNWNFPEEVEGMKVEAAAGSAMAFRYDRFLCELAVSDKTKGIRILEIAETGWDGTLPEMVGGYPVLWLSTKLTFREQGFLFRSPYQTATTLEVIGCELQEEEITVPSEALGRTVSALGTGAFRDMEWLKTVHIPASVKEIQSGAFDNCPALTQVDLANVKTTIWRTAFQSIGVKWLELGGESYSTAVSQEDKDYALFADGTAEIIRWSASGKAVRIPAEIDGHPVISIGREVFESSDITGVEIPDTVERIGAFAFNNCAKLSSVRLPAGLKSLGERCFSFSGLSNVVLPGGLEAIPNSCFYMCSSLTRVTMEEGLRSIGDEAFHFCRKLCNVTLPEGLLTIGTGCFDECGLKKITIPASVESIGDDCFRSYAEDTSWGTLYYTGPEVIFEGDPQVTGKLFGLLDGSADYSYSEFFDRVELFVGHKINKLKIHTTPGTVVDRIFLSPLVVQKTYPDEKNMTVGETPVKKNLEADDIPRDVQILTVPEGVEEIAPGAFREIHALYRVILPDSLKKIGAGAFEGCGGLQWVDFGIGLESIGERAFASCRNLRAIALPDGVAAIPENCFEKDINLLKVSLPAGLTRIENKAFYDCGYLEEIDFSVCGSLESIGEGAFYRSHIKKISLPASLHSLGKEAFFCPIGLASLTLSPSLAEIPANCFWYCSKLKSLEIPEGVRVIGPYAFYNAREMSSLKLPEGLERIEEGAFSTFTDTILLYNDHGRRYSSLKKVAFPESLSFLGNGAFAGCDAMTQVTFASPSLLQEIPDYCFYVCSAMQKMELPEYIRSVGKQAFAWCTRLNQMTIGEGTVSLGNEVFRNCEQLKSLSLPASLETIGANLLQDTGKSLTVSVPDGSAAGTWMLENYPDVKLKTR